MWKALTHKSLVVNNARISTIASNLAKNKININITFSQNAAASTLFSHHRNLWPMSCQLLRFQSSNQTPPPSSASSMPDLKTPLNSYKKSSSSSSSSSSNNKNEEAGQNSSSRRKPDLFKLAAVFASGALAYFVISLYLDSKSSTDAPSATINYSSNNLPGRITPSKSIRKEKNPGNLKLTLYQYVTCPFCCKVRAYLDYFGYSYDLVEVNSINKKQIDWSSYKKVPILAIQVPSANDPDKYDDEILQLNDSTVIISALETFRLDPSKPLKQISTYFEPIKIENEENNAKREYINKYFVMLHSPEMNDTKDISDRKLEREWRKWVDDKFIHAISPNVYRSMGEAFEAFEWFSKAGDWENQFNWFERQSVHYIGALVMYLIGKRLRSRHNLKEDVRESMYDYCNEWVNALNDKFKGGNRPNLADLALYGSIGSFKGCSTFNDILSNTKIRAWYEACREEVENSRGASLLSNPRLGFRQQQAVKNYNNDQQSAKKGKRFGIF